METLTQNALRDTKSHHQKTLDKRASADAQPIEDEQAPGYWDSSPDLANVSGFQSFRHLAWSIIGFAIFIALATFGVLQDFN